MVPLRAVNTPPQGTGQRMTYWERKGKSTLVRVQASWIHRLWGLSKRGNSTRKAFPPSIKDTGKMDFKWATIKSLYEMKLNWFYGKIRALWWSQPLERDVWLTLCKLTRDLYDLKQRSVAIKALSCLLFCADLHHPTLMCDFHFHGSKLIHSLKSFSALSKLFI